MIESDSLTKSFPVGLFITETGIIDAENGVFFPQLPSLFKVKIILTSNNNGLVPEQPKFAKHLNTKPDNFHLQQYLCILNLKYKEQVLYLNLYDCYTDPSNLISIYYLFKRPHFFIRYDC